MAQGLGTSMLQIPNIIKNPLIWLPAIVSSAVLGPVSTMLLHMTSNATGSGMGTAGLIGPIMSFQTMIADRPAAVCITEIALMYFILPGIISLGVSEFLRSRGFIGKGDMLLDV